MIEIQKFYKFTGGGESSTARSINSIRACGMTLALIFTLLSVLVCLPAQALADDVQARVSEDNTQLVSWRRLSGQTRHDTMQAISQDGFKSAETVIVASSENFPDALSATSLAGYYNSPILLTSTNSLTDKCSSEIKRLGAKKVIVVGGTSAVSDKAFSQIQDIVGENNTSRLSGSTRFETSLAIYNEGKTADIWSKTAIVASGEGFADALSMSPWAYFQKSPIFLTDSEGALSDDAIQAIRDDGFEHVVIAGGIAVIPDSTQAQLEEIVGGEDNVTRLAGENRYETSQKVVVWAAENGLSYKGAAVASGQNFPDALSGGAFCGHRGSVLMLACDYDYDGAVSSLYENCAAIEYANVLGGTAAISDTLYAELQGATLEKPEKTAFAVYSQDDQSLNFYKRETVPSVGSTFNGKTATKVFTGIENMPGYSYSQEDGYQGIPEWCELYENVITVTIVDDGIQPKNMDLWFGAFGSIITLPGTDSSDPLGAISESALESINNLDKIDTSKTISMKYTFCYSQKLQTVDIANWDVSKVENFTCCFYFTKFDSLDLSKWVTSSAKDMSYMFDFCGGTNGLDLDLSKFDTSKVQNMSCMFSFCGAKSITGIENWDTSNVENMSNMFSICNKLTMLNLTNWNTSKVTDMSDMFSDCSSLTTLNLSSWNTSSVEVMRGMFYDCSSLTSLNLSNWNTSGVTDMNNMFSNCSLLREVKGVSNWDTSSVTHMALMFSDCSVLTANCSEWNVANVIVNTSFNTGAPGVTPPYFYYYQ